MDFGTHIYSGAYEMNLGESMGERTRKQPTTFDDLNSTFVFVLLEARVDWADGWLWLMLVGPQTGAIIERHLYNSLFGSSRCLFAFVLSPRTLDFWLLSSRSTALIGFGQKMENRQRQRERERKEY